MQKHRRTDGQSAIERLCLDCGLMMTGQRRVIARVLSEANDHPSVEEVHRRALLLDENISIATIYRTVRIFEEKGILQRRDFGSGRARYETADHGHHYHLIEIDTGRVLEFNDAAHEQLLVTLVEGLGYQLVSIRLEVFARRLDAPAKKRDPIPRRDQITVLQRTTGATAGTGATQSLPRATKPATRPPRSSKVTLQARVSTIGPKPAP